jgi:hypothetical protein
MLTCFLCLKEEWKRDKYFTSSEICTLKCLLPETAVILWGTKITKSDWGIWDPRINFENGIKL